MIKKAEVKIPKLITLGTGNITGADPELFLVNSRGTVVRSKRYVELSSNNKKNNTGKTIYDNIAVEFRPSASFCGQYAIDHISCLIREFYHVLLNSDKTKGYTLDTTPARKITKANRVAEVNTFGCSPSLVLTENGIEETIPFTDAQSCEYRSIGGHIHASTPEPRKTYVYQNDGSRPKPEFADANGLRGKKPRSSIAILKDPTEQAQLTQLFDIILGTLGCLFEYRMGNQEAALIRRCMLGYGRAGEFRVNSKSYEYRALSPWWLEHPLLAHLVFNLNRDLIRFWQVEGLASYFLEEFPDRARIEEAINTCDPVMCEQILVRGMHRYRETLSRKGYSISGGKFDSILGSSLRTTPSKANHILQLLAHEEPDWYLHLATNDRDKQIYNSGLYSQNRAPNNQTYSFIQRWRFCSHYWGWKNFAGTCSKALERKYKGSMRRALNGSYVTDTWGVSR